MDRRGFVAAAAGAAGTAGQKHRVVIIGHTGRGNFGHDWDIAFQGLANVEVAAVADPVESGREAARNRSGAARAYADYHEMLAKEKPGIVAICPRWADQRVAMVQAAAEAGAHILMEKPFAATLEQARRLLDLTRRRKVKVQIGHVARLMPETVLARKLFEQGAIGKLLEIRARGKEDRRAGGEDMMVLGTHCFDLMRLFAGDPSWVFAHLTQAGQEVRTDHFRQGSEPIGPIAGDEVAAMFYFDRGVHGYFGSRTNDVLNGPRFGVTLLGSQGALWIPLTAVPSDPPFLLRSTSWASGAWQRMDPPQRLKNRQEVNRVMAADLIDAIEKDREPACSARDGCWTIEMVAGVYAAHQAQRRVAFPLAKA